MTTINSRLDRVAHFFNTELFDFDVKATRNQKLYFMGISLMSTRFFSKEILWEYLRHFDADNSPFIVLVADSLESYNYQYFYSLTDTAAKQKAKRIGENYLRGYEKTCRNFNKCCVALTSDLEDDNRYTYIQKCVVDYFSTNNYFRNAIRAEVKQNLGSYVDLSLTNSDRKPSLLEMYVLGEISITLYLYQMSGKKELYQVSRNRQSILSSLVQYKDLLSITNVSLTDESYIHWTPEDEQRAAA